MKKIVIAMLIVGLFIVGFPKDTFGEVLSPKPLSPSEVSNFSMTQTTVNVEGGMDSGDAALAIVLVLFVGGIVVAAVAAAADG